MSLTVPLVKRGSSLCQQCGHSNGNRSLVCKKCGCPLPKRVKITATEQKSATREPKVYAFDNKVSSLLDSGILPDGSEIYSIKIREQGPDYRYCNEILNTSG